MAAPLLGLPPDVIINAFNLCDALILIVFDLCTIVHLFITPHPLLIATLCDEQGACGFKFIVSNLCLRGGVSPI